MEENNFKKLEREAEEKFEESSDAIKNNVTGQRNFWSLLGDLIDLYIPNVISTLIGGEKKNSSSNLINENQDRPKE